jgi:hypothetical protein
MNASSHGDCPSYFCTPAMKAMMFVSILGSRRTCTAAGGDYAAPAGLRRSSNGEADPKIEPAAKVEVCFIKARRSGQDEQENRAAARLKVKVALEALRNEATVAETGGQISAAPEPRPGPPWPLPQGASRAPRQRRLQPKERAYVVND